MNKWLLRILLLLLYQIAKTATPAFAQLPEAIPPFQNIIFLPSTIAFDTTDIRSALKKGNELIWTKPDSAMLLFQHAATQSKRNGYADGIVKSLLQIAHTQAAQAHFTESFETYKEASAYCIYCKEKNLLARIYCDVATTYLLQSDYPDAMVYYLKALKEQQQNGLGEHPDVLFTYANLAYLQSKLGQHLQALKYLEYAEQIARKRHYEGHLGFILNNKGEAYSALDQSYKALQCYEEGLAQYNKGKLLSPIQKTEIRQSLYISLGTLMLKEQQQRKAIAYLQEAMQMSGCTSPYFTFIFPNYQLGKAYYELHEYHKAASCLVPALARARELQFHEDMPEALGTLAAVYEKLGKYRDAYRQQKLLIDLKDSLMSVEKSRDIRQMELKYLAAQKNKDIAEKKLLISRQHNQLMHKNTWLLVCSVTALALLLLCLLLLMRYKNNQHQQRIQTVKIAAIERDMELVEREKNLLKRDEKLKVMHALMQGEEKERQRLAAELHDGLGGMLAAIQMQFSALQSSTCPADKNQRIVHIQQMLRDAAKETRETAHNLMPDVILKHSLVTALELFCNNINQSGGLHIDLQLHNTSLHISKSTELCIYRIVQELVQNIMKHAHASEATIQITQQGETLFILAEDNGVGFDTSTPTHGLGLRNLESRVQSLQGIFSLESHPDGGTIGYIELNLHPFTVLSA